MESPIIQYLFWVSFSLVFILLSVSVVQVISTHAIGELVPLHTVTVSECVHSSRVDTVTVSESVHSSRVDTVTVSECVHSSKVGYTIHETVDATLS